MKKHEKKNLVLVSGKSGKILRTENNLVTKNQKNNKKCF